MANSVCVSSSILDSMIDSERASRREVSDISTLIFDGVDAIMLSDETALGSFPEKAVLQLSKCCAEAEKIIDYKLGFEDIKLNSPTAYGTVESVACSAVQTSLDLSINTIIVHTESGKLAKLVSKYRPNAKIVVFSFENYVVK